MNNYFETEILRIERELLGLKASQQKFANDMVTLTKSMSLSIPLSLTSPTVARGGARVRITANQPTIFSATLDKYYDDIMLNQSYPRETREAQLSVSKISDTEYFIQLTVFGTQTGYNNDVEVLSGGGSVTLNYTLTVQCVHDFNMEAE